jgi:hypothetical protein
MPLGKSVERKDISSDNISSDNLPMCKRGKQTDLP